MADPPRGGITEGHAEDAYCDDVETSGEGAVRPDDSEACGDPNSPARRADSYQPEPRSDP